jgi:DNA-binding MarR family transcriptional regulator
MDQNEQRFRVDLESAKRASVAQLLFKCARLVNERALARVRAQRGIEIRAAHTTLFPHIDVTRGSRLTDLAQALGVSKQAIGQLVDELCEMGVLERRPDPDDGRAKRVCYTNVGRQGLLDGLAVLREEEHAMQQTLGADRFEQLHQMLLMLEAMLEATSLR